MQFLKYFLNFFENLDNFLEIWEKKKFAKFSKNFPKIFKSVKILKKLNFWEEKISQESKTIKVIP